MSKPKTEIKVLIIDDSALIRALLTKVLDAHPQIKVVGSAVDPFDAREKIKQLMPDVLTLDIEMPKMNGIDFLRNLMRLRPMPVVMISTLTQEGAPATLEALELGAVDYVPKPVNDVDAALADYQGIIIEKVLCAASANVGAQFRRSALSDTEPQAVVGTLARQLKPGFLCALGASTGGTEAIKAVVSSLPEDAPAMVVTQHIPATFSASFAKRVDAKSRVSVHEAEHNQKLEPGNVYIAPGHSHLRVVARGGHYFCQLGNDDVINRHRPAVEALFDSVTRAAGCNSMGVLLTGMGNDGAEALLRMKQAGGITVAQDEDTSVVWGMPGVAVRLNAAQKVLPLGRISRYILLNAYE
ncbi:protein-glutamate methylesterase/protein-glutamine glutaminase [Teredinibacter franksiae]|uniref:protein-glutamate methylesterase/protein-glutamine glutaminase n=1 Tax=Teredinibacter franksiae TaxID=2761453 RepID=UPI001623D4E6|nr:chemotaxis response regulator protein-glutamate methylesterase [Teredinibacter franksiae]